jgi:hypothetical protein
MKPKLTFFYIYLVELEVKKTYKEKLLIDDWGLVCVKRS